MNSLRSACRLPPELILQILKFAQVLDPPRYDERPHIGWLSLTQASHLWRETALGCSSLWCDVATCLGRDWADAFVVRSCLRPLSVRCGLKTTSYRENVQYGQNINSQHNGGWRLAEGAIAHVIGTVPRRIVTLDLEAPPASLQYILSRVMGATAGLSSLIALTIQSVHARGTPRLPALTTANVFPSLTHLSVPDNLLLNNIWRLFPSSLTSLEITSARARLPDARTPLLALFHFLRSATELVDLSLSFEQLSAWSTLPYTRIRTLTLTNLKTLSLSGEAVACLDMLTSLYAHRGLCKLDVTVTGDWDAMRVDPLLSAAVQLTNRLHPQPYTSLSITWGSSNADPELSELCLSARRAVPCPLRQEGLPRAHPDLTLKFAPLVLHRSQARDLLTKLLSSVSTTGVCSLYVSLPGLSTINWTAAHWLNLFRGAQAVQELRIRGDCSSLIHSLGLSTANRPAVNQQLEPVTDATMMFFPSLRSLVFEDVNFNYADARVPAHQLFSRVLSSRAPLSGIPRTLELRRCQLEQDVADWWESSVPARMRNWNALSLTGAT